MEGDDGAGRSTRGQLTPRRHPAQVTWRLVLGVALGSLSIAPALGQIYKYKDEQGRWQFSDKPPPEATPAELIETKPRKGPLGKDLAARLSKAIAEPARIM